MISKDVLKTVIVENEEHLAKIEKVFPRKMILPESKSLRKVVVLYGVRRSGKSFILVDIFKKNLGRALYIDFEDERLSNIQAEELDKIRESFFELKPHLLKDPNLVFLFDEVQNVPSWERYIRRLVEKFGVQVFCAGSSSKTTPEEIHTALRGRVWCVKIFPFSFKELVEAKIGKLKIDGIYGEERFTLMNLFNEYFRFGGLPEVIFASNEFEKRKILKDYVQAMYFRDMVERFRIKNLELLNALWERLFNGFAAKFSLTAFYNQYRNSFPFSKDTLYEYYAYFLKSMIVFEVRKYTESSYERQRNPAKVYLIDHGLARYVTSEDNGRVLENIVSVELRRRGYELFYFKQERECDFVAKKDSETLLVQVCWCLDKNNTDRELSGILEASKFIKANNLLIITSEQEDTLKVNGERVSIVPAWKWLLTDDTRLKI